ncbi:MAG: hypothetical protein GC129_06890 [Proteobacteria bacterium]|nr:hypothetical protein [Pseudomonadota bacterium]
MVNFLTTQPWPVYLVLFIFCARLGALTLKLLPPHINPSVFSFLTTAVSLALYLVGWLAAGRGAEPFTSFLFNPLGWLALATGFCMALYDVSSILMYRAGAPFGPSYALIRVFTILSATAFGLFLFAEGMPPLKIAGIALCLAGIFLLVSPAKPQKPAKTRRPKAQGQGA